MELILEIPDEKAKELNLTDKRILFDELEHRMAGRRLQQAMLNAHDSARMYGIDQWTMDDINDIIKEVRAEHAKEKSSN